MERSFYYLFLFLLFQAGDCFAKSKSLTDYSQLFYVGGDLQFTDSAADDVVGATYTKKMVNSGVLFAGLGVRLFHFLYIGARYEYWLARRTFNDGVQQEDTLNYQSIGGELGIYRGNPRFYWTVTAGWFHPLKLQMDSSRGGISSVYKHEPSPASYQARLTVGVKLNNRLSFRIEGGYRHANFGDMTSGSSSLLSNGAPVNLSGPFAGAGLGLHF